MKNPKNLLIFALIGGVIGTGFGYGLKSMMSPPPVSEIQFSAADITAVINRQVEDWNAGNIEGFMRAYWQNKDLRFTSGGDVTRGWKATLGRYETRYPDRAAMGKLDLDVQDITKIGPSQALVLGRWKLTRAADTPSGLFTLHMKHMHGAWVIVSDHTSSAN